MTEDIQLWSNTDKIKYLFSTTDKSALGNLFLIPLKNKENTQHIYKRKTNHSSE